MALRPRLSGLLLACSLLSALLGLSALAQNATPAASAASSVQSAAAQPHSRWSRLSASQQAALAPLAEQWGLISETQRSKWLTIARNFDQLSPAEQQVMQARMKEWVKLSPVQRNQARLNFNTLQGVSKDEKKTRWDEYQALSEAEKRKLSAGVLSPARTAAPSPKPTASDRLVQPTLRSMPAAALPPRAPIDKNTLLPLPTPASSEAPLTPPAASPAPESAAGRETPAS